MKKADLLAKIPTSVLVACLLPVLLYDRVHATAQSAPAPDSLVSRRHGSSSVFLNDGLQNRESPLVKGSSRPMPSDDGVGPREKASEEEQATKSNRKPSRALARLRASSPTGFLKNLPDQITPKIFMTGSLFATAILLMSLGSDYGAIPKESFSIHQENRGEAPVMAGLSGSSRNKLLLGAVGLLFFLASSLAVPAPSPAPGLAQPPPVARVPKGGKGQHSNEDVIRVGHGWKDEHGNLKQGETLIELMFNGQLYEMYLPKSTEAELKAQPGHLLEALERVLTRNAQLTWARDLFDEVFYWEWGRTPTASILYDSTYTFEDVQLIFYVPTEVARTLHSERGSPTEGGEDLVALVQTLARVVHTPTAVPLGVRVKTWKGEHRHHKATTVPVQENWDEWHRHKTCVVGRGWQDGTKTQRIWPPVDFYGFLDGQNAIQFKLKTDNNHVHFKVILTRNMEEALGKKQYALREFIANLSSPPQDEPIFPEHEGGGSHQGALWKFSAEEGKLLPVAPPEPVVGPVKRWGTTRDIHAVMWIFEAGETTYHVYIPRDVHDALIADRQAWSDAGDLVYASVLKMEEEQRNPVQTPRASLGSARERSDRRTKYPKLGTHGSFL